MEQLRAVQSKKKNVPLFFTAVGFMIPRKINNTQLLEKMAKLFKFIMKEGDMYYSVPNEKIIETSYSRYDSPYIQAEKKDNTLTFSYRGKSLFLDFENLQRVY